MSILSRFRDIIRGALGTYVLSDKLDAIRSTLAYPDPDGLRAVADDMRMRLDHLEGRSRAAVLEAMRLLRAEYTVMPRFAFHQPTDYEMDSAAPQFEPVVRIPGEVLPLPALPDRHGYSMDDTEYLARGSFDADLIRAQIKRYLPSREPIAIMDFGCSTRPGSSALPPRPYDAGLATLWRGCSGALHRVVTAAFPTRVHHLY